MVRFNFKYMSKENCLFECLIHTHSDISSTMFSPSSSSSSSSPLPAECEVGNEEYKWKLVGLTDQQKAHRSTQMQYRLNEGNGYAVYRIGYLDSGQPLGITKEEMNESIDVLSELVSSLSSCFMQILDITQGEIGYFLLIYI